MSTITTPVSASLSPRQGQYETVDDIPSTTDITPVSAPPGSRQYETVDDIPSTTPVSAKLSPGTGQYEANQGTATTSGTYNSTSRQDVEPLSVYQDVKTNHLTGAYLGSCGPYKYGPGQLGKTSEIPLKITPMFVCRLRRGILKTRRSPNTPIKI
ncbi:hypothetical protein RRG08_057500 [Elysia crispata]|uniref:Uncharacterized protein n=1 Tax=Elysia crispata TaxID=231223 RepID=A0AAE1DKG8_9GAST|nr:hypothetical protein RRG08_057500 [Elysia crispata]